MTTQSDIAKVREALADARSHYLFQGMPGNADKADEAMSLCSRLAARIEELEGALKPFAEFADDENFIGTVFERQGAKGVAIMCSGVTGNSISRNDLERARAALAQEKDDG